MGIKLRESPSGKEISGTADGQTLVWNNTTKRWDVGAGGPTGSSGSTYSATGVTGSTGPNWKALTDVQSDFQEGPLTDFTVDGATGVITYTGVPTASFLACCSLSVSTDGDEIHYAIALNGELIGTTDEASEQGEQVGLSAGVQCFQRLVELETGDTLQPVFRNVDENAIACTNSYFTVKG